MRHVYRAIFVLLAACGGAAHVAAPTSSPAASGGGVGPDTTAGVTFTKKRPSVGARCVVREHNETSLEMEATFDGKTNREKDDSVETIERRSEILAMGDGGAATRVKVTYAVHHKEASGKVSAMPVEGKTYIVEGHGGKEPPVVTDVEGNPAPGEEASLVAGDYKHLGRVDPLFHALPEHPIVAGDSMDDMAKVLLDDDAAEGLEHVEVRFEGERDVGGSPAGVFDVELTGKLFGESKVSISAKIALCLSTGWEVESDATGPLEISQKGQKGGKPFSVVAHGVMRLHKETSYPDQ
jgi:hypothetical protein